MIFKVRGADVGVENRSDMRFKRLRHEQAIKIGLDAPQTGFKGHQGGMWNVACFACAEEILCVSRRVFCKILSMRRRVFELTSIQNLIPNLVHNRY